MIDKVMDKEQSTILNQRANAICSLQGVALTGTPSTVVLLRNMVAPGEVDEGLEDEVAEEAQKYGAVLRVVIFEVDGGQVAPEQAVRCLPLRWMQHGAACCLSSQWTAARLRQSRRCVCCRCFSCGAVLRAVIFTVHGRQVASEQAERLLPLLFMRRCAACCFLCSGWRPGGARHTGTRQVPSRHQTGTKQAPNRHQAGVKYVANMAAAVGEDLCGDGEG